MLAEDFPGLRHAIHADGSGATAAGTVTVDIGAGYRADVEIELRFPEAYPHEPPEIFDRGFRWVPNPDRHINEDHSFCLWLAHVDVPDVSTVELLRKLLLQVLLFLRDQFVFDDLKRWPGKQWAHGPVAAYAQHVRETLAISERRQLRGLWPLVLGTARAKGKRCPCGNLSSYARCHLESVESLRQLRGFLRRHDKAVYSSIQGRLHA
jgi:ubiquitin-protein ligase